MTYATVEYATVEEAASELRVHPSTCYRKLERGEWDDVAFKVGPAWRIDLQALLEKLKTRPISRRKPADDPMLQTPRARFEALMSDVAKEAA